jgi:addiction module HigA family antidote
MDHSPKLKRVHPGEILEEEFLKPWRMTPDRLAAGIGVSPAQVGEILEGRRGISAETALRLSRFLGCTPEFWLGLQAAFDLEEAQQRLAEELRSIPRYQHVGPVWLDDQPAEGTTEAESAPAA